MNSDGLRPDPLLAEARRSDQPEPERVEPFQEERPRGNSNPKTYRAICRMLPPLGRGARVLDVPSGTGALTWELERLGYRVTSGDYDVGQYRLKSPACLPIDLNETIPLPDDHFDAAVFCEGPQVLENPARALREFARVLKSGSPLVVSLPNVGNLYSRLRFLFTGFYNKFPRPYDELRGEGNFNPVSFPELRYLLRRAGFSIVRVRTNRYKASHLLAAPIAPFAWLATGLLVAQKHRRHVPAAVRLAVWRQLTSFPAFFGDALVVLSRKEP
jgi:SAM-dependent methyltransferase